MVWHGMLPPCLNKTRMQKGGLGELMDVHCTHREERKRSGRKGREGEREGESGCVYCRVVNLEKQRELNMLLD